MILRLHADRYAVFLVRSVEAAEGCGCWWPQAYGASISPANHAS
jgi:heme A synthase